MLERPRLLRALRSLRPLTLVCAPPGYGKTALIDSWVARASGTRTIVRTTMREDSREPEVLWAGFVAALAAEGIMPQPGDHAVVGSTDPDVVVSVSRCLSAHAGPVVWVLDTGDHSLPDVVGEQVSRLLRQRLANLAIVVLTRSDPPLPLNRYRLHDLVTDVRASDLAMTSTEVAEFMALEGLHLGPADVDSLLVRTGGWPAGLKFAAVALAGRTDLARAIADFRGDRGNVATYLMSEVLAIQSPQDRQFLLRTCIVDELSPGLVEALAGPFGDRATLEEMSAGASFVERVGDRDGQYRYHSLFREFLRSQLSFEDAGLVVELHGIAAAWLVAHDEPAQAVRHAIAGRSWTTAADILLRRFSVGSLLYGSTEGLLLQTLAPMPDDVPGPSAAVVRAVLALTRLDADGCGVHLDQARSWVARTPRGPDSQALALTVAVLTAIRSSYADDPGTGLRAALAADRALHVLPARDLQAHGEMVALVAGCMGRVMFERGDLRAAADALGHGAERARSVHLDLLASELSGLLALCEAARGHLRRAADVAAGAGPPFGASVLPVGSAPPPEAALLALAWVRADQCESAVAAEMLQGAERHPASYDSRILVALTSLVRARLLRATGHGALALSEVRAARAPIDLASPSAPLAGWVRRALVTDEATSMLGAGDWASAAALMLTYVGQGHPGSDLVFERAILAAAPGTYQPPEAPEAPEGSVASHVDHLLLLATRRLGEGDAARSTAHLEHALALAAPEGLRRPFVDVGDDVRDLLDTSGLEAGSSWLRTARPVEEVPAVALVRRGPAVRVLSGPSTPVLPLTAKEKEVLGHLAELLTTEEIGQVMFVSVNTVRSHVRSILRKLGVARRNEAVRRAWDLDLLAPAPEARGDVGTSV